MNDTLPATVTDESLYREFQGGASIVQLARKYGVSTNLIRFHLKRRAKELGQESPEFDVGVELHPEEYLEAARKRHAARVEASEARRRKKLELYREVYLDYIGQNKRRKPLTTNQLARKHKVKRQTITLWLHYYRMALKSREVRRS